MITRELAEHREEFIARTGIGRAIYIVVEQELLERIRIVAESSYYSYLDRYANAGVDPGDLAFLATCTCVAGIGVWTHDNHFKKTGMMLTNIDLLRLITERSS